MYVCMHAHTCSVCARACSHIYGCTALGVFHAKVVETLMATMTRLCKMNQTTIIALALIA